MLAARSSICLNMIVRNESALIERCLAAAAAHIDCYVICDTGSTDDTVEKIRTFFAARNIPGVIAHTTFQDFEQARNFALDAARDSDLEFDYLLLCDADMELVVERPAFREELAGVPYLVAQRSAVGDLLYQNLRLVPRHCPARYRGVTHEYLDVTPASRVGFDGIWFRDHAAGANRTDKFDRDITLLTQGLKTEPDNERYVFYLANTYFDAGQPAEAMTWYQKRVQMGGWAEEIFYSSYRIGGCLERLGRDAEMIAQYLQTYQRFPHRAEPLHALAQFYQRRSENQLAFLFADACLRVPPPSDGALFVEAQVYDWRLTDIVAVSLYWMGHPGEAATLNRRLLEIVPEDTRSRIQTNLEVCETALRSQ
jgi:glycosyltransferase involved in cell wall biosynthesis